MQKWSLIVPAAIALSIGVASAQGPAQRPTAPLPAGAPAAVAANPVHFVHFLQAQTGSDVWIAPQAVEAINVQSGGSLNQPATAIHTANQTYFVQGAVNDAEQEISSALP